MCSARKLAVYNWLMRLLPHVYWLTFWRYSFLRWAGVNVAPSAQISPSAVFHGGGEIKIGDGAHIADNVFINCHSGGLIFLGSNVYIADRAYLTTEGPEGRLIVGDNSQICNCSLVQAMRAEINIGANVFVAHACAIKTTTHEVQPDAACIGGKSKYLDITIMDGTWICAGAIIIPGVTVGRKNVVAAGAVVTKDTADYVLMVGVPAVQKKLYRGDRCDD